MRHLSSSSPKLLGTKYTPRRSTPSGTTKPKYASLGRVVSTIFSRAASLEAPGMTIPGAVGTQCPSVNDPILARAVSHVTSQVETIPMTLHGI